MSVNLQHRTQLPVQLMVATGIVLTCGLTGCAEAPDTTPYAATINASRESDVLADSSDKRYELDGLSVSIMQPLQGVAVPAAIDPSGYFVVNDGVITEAWFETTFGESPGARASATFTLTEPTVLRPSYSDGDNEGSVTATGTLTVGGIAHPNTEAQFFVVSLDDDHAELDVLVTTPADLLALADDTATVTARLSFS